ncbi:hypothetical protein M408DRAFT_332572 [Serendipita vermifera MAFF 305830]|uniref:Uncharacterized protein n=1 Tax=Serendipita vermifera MAFF 305830 TaxID=933852 RepID=A0A0C2X0D7_SERVB|nr:hypothetical protein M408DRAFT_332572 [Serendipita vermifera MAFF 305830]
MTNSKEDLKCSEGGEHDFGGKRVTTCNWISMIVCCPCYITLALYRVAATPLPCRSCNGIQDEDEYGNPRCRKCGLNMNESMALKDLPVPDGHPQLRSSQYGAERRPQS